MLWPAVMGHLRSPIDVRAALIMLRSEVRFLLAPRKSPGQGWFLGRRVGPKSAAPPSAKRSRVWSSFPQVRAVSRVHDSPLACPIDEICCPGGARLGHARVIDVFSDRGSDIEGWLHRHQPNGHSGPQTVTQGTDAIVTLATEDPTAGQRPLHRPQRNGRMANATAAARHR
jgi:hypothetical protein